MSLLLTVGLLLTSVTLGSVGQILYKKGLKGKFKKVDVKEIIKVFLTPKIAGGLVCYFGSAVIYLYALSRAQLSFAYPFFASGYALVTFLSWLILKEKISKVRLFGVAIIICGVVLVGFS